MPFLLRLCNYFVCTLSGWSAFNALTNQLPIPNPHTIGYCQVLDASPTELATVYTLLRRSIAMADQLRQQDVVVVVDQAIYAKAKDVVWSRPQEFKRIVLCMGAFHICCNFLGVISKRFADGGLSDILVESGTVALGSLTGVLSGHHYNRAVRAHKLMFESLLHLKWIAFGNWISTEHANLTTKEEDLKMLLTRFETFTGDTFQKFIQSPMLLTRFETCTGDTIQKFIQSPVFLEVYNEF